MKFFSERWHRGDMAAVEADLIPTAYLAHLRALRPPLPADAMRLGKEVSLHDGIVREAVNAAVGLRLVIRAGDQQIGYFDASILYDGVKVSNDDLKFLTAAVGTRRIELLYDEFDASNDGGWTHSLLFWPYREITVQFDQIALSVSRVSGRFQG